MQQIKGESSYWINKNSLINYKFRWAVEYYAASVSESHLTRVRNYIRNQERHHKVQTWVAECDEFMVRHGFMRLESYSPTDPRLQPGGGAPGANQHSPGEGIAGQSDHLLSGDGKR